MSYMDFYNKLRSEAEQSIKDKREDKIRVVLGYSICSISVGANEVLRELQQAIQELNLDNVIMETTGCMGLCSKEPIVEIHTEKGERFTYEFVTPKIARAILVSHALYNESLEEYLINH